MPNTRDDARRRMLAGVPVTERRLELAAIPTAVLEGGDGPPLVLLHGAGEFAGLWLRVVPGLAAGHRAVAPDLRATAPRRRRRGRWAPSGCWPGWASWSGGPARPRRPWSAGASAAPWRPASPPPTATAWPAGAGRRPRPGPVRPGPVVRPGHAPLRRGADRRHPRRAVPPVLRRPGPPVRAAGRALDRPGRLRPGPGPDPGHGGGHGRAAARARPAGDDPPLEQPAAFLAALQDSLAAGATAGRAER
jgi:hypothetical protein